MPTIAGFLDAHPYSQSTRHQYELLLLRLTRDYPDLTTLTVSQLREWIYSQPWGDSARWLGFSCFRAFIRWGWGPDHPALKLKIKRVQPGPQRCLTPGQAEELISTFDRTTPNGLRDLCLCCLLIDSGLRESEVCRVELGRLDLAARNLCVLCKGGQWGWACYSATTAGFIRDWLNIRGDYAKPRNRYLYCSIGGTQPGEPLTASGLRVIVRRWGERIGIKLSPHDFRRSFATLSTRAGAPSRLVQLAGRWSSIEMVERYTQSLDLSDFQRYSPVEYILKRG